MSNNIMYLTMEDIRTIVAAQEIIYMRRMIARMEKFIECPTPPPPPGGGLAFPIKLVNKELNALHELKTLRAKYVRRVHVDPECAKAIAKICRENAKLVGGLAKIR